MHVATAVDGKIVIVNASMRVAAVDGKIVAVDALVCVATTVDGEIVAVDTSVRVATAFDGKFVAVNALVCVATTFDGKIVAVNTSVRIANAVSGKFVAVDSSSKLVGGDAFRRICNKVDASIIKEKRSLWRPCEDNLKVHNSPSFVHLLQQDWLFTSKMH
jgi:hypothetical protein